MKTKKMTLESVTEMLAIFTTYWPSFTPVEGMAKSWADAMSEYETCFAWDALKQFRTEEARVFAPSVSEFIGRMDSLKAVKKNKHDSEALLIAPPKSFSDKDEEATELYTYKTSRTTPKRNKDDQDEEIRKAVRVTPSRRVELERRAHKEGLRKISVLLSNNRKGYVWERI